MSGFIPVDFGNISKFNSAVSSKLISIYENQLDVQIAEESARPKSQSFAPSSIRCPRISWFRLRGVQPDVVKKPDKALNFSAAVGTACHEMIQHALINADGVDWIDVKDYLVELNPQYTYSVEQSGYETRVSIESPPIRFAVDGILKIDGVTYLLEIKSSDYGVWKGLADPKPVHHDQVVCYASLLNIEKVLMIYIDRTYGDVKCFEVSVPIEERQKTWNMFKYVQDMVEANLAPEKLPPGDSWCNPSMCNYYEKCKQW